jgi:predicted transposase YbfD/YdcC
MRSNKRKDTKPCHIVSAWSREDGFCLGQKAVDEKSNEITAIPKVLESIEIKGQVVTIDAMGTQTAIVETIRKRRADYVLAVKGNQGSLEADIRLYFEDPQIRAGLGKSTGYKKTVEKAHGQIEIREYYQTQDIGWMHQKKQWKGLKSIGMEKKTIRKGETEREEYRYYISSLLEDIELFERAVRGHWAVESMHWHLDVTFKEDANTTLDKTAAQNQNIVRKWCLSMLKLIEIRGTKMSLRRKRFNISFAPAQFIEELMKI